uniref:Uncharacterized protein n=1 Tax=Candidatus Kentrum sp. FM TaxID=2126340 RepID=A0A450RZW3_9GAMM|nr:MAG: hypothetical protein BECKFM1743C_GA0114222_1001710 [Candidatus Kentron sp. FM]VFJ61239.1 MAG: hypothetical protein BECKFM1743A_GA0114220_1028010 [Candidatus Kentron sp. FM]VFK11444.1 MAG: hypothetical protein BECKFM1743B_GA0114221_1018210 [Candidatus Kentron sp. FM]
MKFAYTRASRSLCSMTLHAVFIFMIMFFYFILLEISWFPLFLRLLVLVDTPNKATVSWLILFPIRLGAFLSIKSYHRTFWKK